MKKAFMVMLIILLLVCSLVIPVSAFTVEKEDTQVTDDWLQIEYIDGDMNGDEDVNILDLIRIKKHMADQTVWLNVAVADLRVDNVIDIEDVVGLKKLLLEL